MKKQLNNKNICKSITISRDEMNLAEFPLAVLSTRVNPDIKTLEFQDTIYTKDRQPITRRWIITGADKFGLPTSSDDEVLIGLLKLTADQDFKNQKVEFTRYELLKALKWTTEGRSYIRLQKSLDRLSGVRIKASNAFFDNKTKENCTKNFGIIDAYEINTGRGEQAQSSYFIWGETMFDSFQKGNIKRLDLDFYLGLKSAITKRLYRYLDKHFWHFKNIEINLFRLAHEKLGISRNFKYASSLKQQLETAITELQEKNFVKRVEYIGKGLDTKVIFYRTEAVPHSINVQSSEVVHSSSKTHDNNDTPLEDFSNEYDNFPFNKSASVPATKVLDITPEDPVLKLTKEITEKLLDRGIKEGQIKRLLSDKNVTSLSKIIKIISYFDYLRNKKSPLVSISPVGFLFRAVQKEEQFYLPKNFATSEDSVIANKNIKKNDQLKNEELKLKEQFNLERNKQIAEIRKEMEPAILENISQEVTNSLANIKNIISKERFDETVVHAVNEKIANLFALANFEEWIKERKVV